LAGEEMIAFMREQSDDTRRLLFDLNGSYHTPEEIVTLFSQITNSKIDNSFRLFPPFYTDFGKNIHVGKKVFINSCCQFQDQGGIFIGDGALIGHSVVMATLNHGFAPNDRQNLYHAPIHIGKGAWIGAHATILPNVTIGDNAIVGAGSVVAKDVPDSARQIQRYIRLTNLIPEILDMVDEKKIAFNPAVELSYLKPSEQKEFLEAMDYAQASPSLSQAQRLKKLSQEGDCTLDAMCEVMNEIKKDELDHVTIKNEVLRKYFPKSYTPKQMQDTIIRLLEKWQRSKQRDMER